MHRLLIICLLAGLTGLSATACTGDDDESAASPEQVADRLQAAKRMLDRAGSIRLTLRTDRLPEGVNGITKAAGVATHAPAFRGTITVAAELAGLTAAVPPCQWRKSSARSRAVS